MNTDTIIFLDKVQVLELLLDGYSFVRIDRDAMAIVPVKDWIPKKLDCYWLNEYCKTLEIMD